MPAAWSKITRSALLLAAVAASLTTAVAQPATNVIFPVTQVWSYMLTASDTTFCLDGTGWETEGFDDSAWPAGPGGFTGGADELFEFPPAWFVGLLNTTSLPAPTPSSGRPQYFRTHFNIASTNNLALLVLSNRIDDQAVFYLNGTRVADYHHPNNPESCTPGGAGGNFTNWVVITLYPSNWVGVLQPGDNVLAVSVHQNAATSPYMVFASLLSSVSSGVLRLDVASDPALQATDLIWPTGVLQWNTNLSRGIGWADVPGSGDVGLATSPYTVYWGPGEGSGKANGTNQMFFRLRF